MSLSTPEGRPRRPLRLAVALGFAVAILVGLWLALPRLVEALLLYELRAAGLPDAELRVARIGSHQAAITGLSLGAAGEIAADEIAVDYAPGDLVRGRVERVVLRGLRLAVGLEGPRPSLGSLDAPLAALGAVPETGAPPLPTIESAPTDFAAMLEPLAMPVVIEDSRLTLATPLGGVDVPFHGQLRPDGAGGFAADFAVAAESDVLRLAGRLTLALVGATVDGRLDIAEGALAHPAVAATAVDGELRFSATSAGLSAATARLRLAGLALPTLSPAVATASLTTEFSPARASAALDLRDATGEVALTATADLDGLDAAPRLAAAAALVAPAAAGPWRLAGLPAPAAGAVRLSATLAADLPPLAGIDPAAVLARPLDLLGGHATGTARFDLANLDWPQGLGAVAATGALDLTVEPDALAVSVATPLRLAGILDPVWLDSLGLPADLRAVAGGPLELGADKLALRLRPANDRAELDADLGLALKTSGPAALSGRLAGRIDLDAAGRPDRFDLGDARLEVTGLTVAGAVLDHAALTATLAGTPAAIAGNAGLEIAARGLRFAGVAADSVALSAGADIAVDGGRLTARLRDDGAVTARGLTVPGVSLGAGPLRLPLRPTDEPLLSATFGDAAPLLAHALALGPLEIDGQLRQAAEPEPVRALLPPVTLSGAWDAAGGYRATARFDGGRVELPARQAAASDIAAEIVIDPAAGLRADYRATLAHLGKPPLVVPLRLVGTAALAGSQLDFAAGLADAGHRFAVEAKGRHDLATGSGRLNLSLPRIEFAPGGLRPRDLAPVLGRRIESAAGAVALAGDVSWVNGRIGADLKLLLEDLSLATSQIDVRRLNAVIAFDGLAPLSTPPDQQIAVGLIGAGLPLTDGLLTFRLEPGPKLAIAGARLRLAGGEVGLGPVTIDPALPRQELRLSVAGVDLQQAFKLANIGDLVGTGRLSGEIPVVIEGGRVTIADGILTGTEPGRISYLPETPPPALQEGNESVRLALSAMSNFRYDELRLNLDRQADGEMVVAVHIKGMNPGLYGGYPVEFNLNVSGRLDQILDRSLAGYRVPDTIRDKLMQFPGR